MGLDITGLGSVADLANTVVDKFFPDKVDEGEKLRAKTELEKAISDREARRDEVKGAVMTQELTQGDNYTKRARPTIVYAGLGFIFLVHVFLPAVAFLTGKVTPELTLPTEFWVTWGSVCSIYSLGRSAEKRGVAQQNNLTGKLTKLIVG